MLSAFLLVFGVAFLIVLFVTRPEAQEKRTRERMDAVVKLQSPAQQKVDLGVTRPVNGGFSRRLTARFHNYKFAQMLEEKLRYAGWKMTVGNFMLITASVVTGLAIAAFLAFGKLPLVGIAFAVGIGGNLGFLRWKGSRRLKKFNGGLADSIDLMSRALRAGHSMSSAIEVVAQQSPDPIGPEFSKCAQQQRFGIPFRDALLELGEQIPSQDLQFLITAILVQKETGGDLTEILDRTSEVIRERVRIQGEVQTRTAQGRLTGWILSSLPVILLGGISILSPGYSHVLFDDPLGQKLLYTAGALIFIGGYIIRRIVDIKV